MPEREETKPKCNLHPARRIVSRNGHGSQKNPRGCHAASPARNDIPLAFLWGISSFLVSRSCDLLGRSFLLWSSFLLRCWRRFRAGCSQRPLSFPLDVLASAASLDNLIILFSHKLMATSWMVKPMGKRNPKILSISLPKQPDFYQKRA